MKTVGERIRQARCEIGMSGDELAKRAGYKNQSAIGNLENRAGSTGGRKISDVAAALGVSVDWILNGPDGEKVPFLRRQAQQYGSYLSVSEATPNSAWPDPQIQEAISLLQRMSPAGRTEALLYLKFMAQQHSNSTTTENPWEHYSFPNEKAA